MALADLMKKGFLTSATATVATPATHRGANHLTVATVAAVAVAKHEKTRANPATVATVAGVAVAKPPSTEPAFDGKSPAQFRFDLVQAEIDAGETVGELYRANNMAWEFMQADGMAFEDAIRLAAEIVVSGQVAACEAAYADVMAIFLKANHAKD